MMTTITLFLCHITIIIIHHSHIPAISSPFLPQQQQGVVYSDFMTVAFVDAPVGYVADTYKSVADIMESGTTMKTTDIVLNSPIVPTGSFLQNPMKKGTDPAPIARKSFLLCN